MRQCSATPPSRPPPPLAFPPPSHTHTHTTSPAPRAAEEEEEEEGGDEAYRARRRARAEEEEGGAEEAEADVERFNLDDFNVPLQEWIRHEPVRVEVRRLFRSFLDHFKDEAQARIHERAIDKMCAEGGQSLVVSYLNLSRFAPTLAIWLADQPLGMLELFNAVAKTTVHLRFPDYRNPVCVRVCDLPIPDSLRDLRQAHLGVLVRVQGVVTKRTGVMPQLSLVRFKCDRCGTLSEPMQQTGGAEVTMRFCPVCPKEAGPASGTIDVESTLYRNFQRLTLQESPGSVPAGRVPRSKEVILAGDLVDCARPGEEVDVTGVYTHQFDASLNARNGFPVFGTVIEANYVKRLSDNAAHLNITEADRREFDALGRDPNIVRRVVRSIAPSIYGNERAKLACALAMFGGREKNVKNKHRIRGDINVLLLGDPGVAKSQILKYTEKTAPRCVYTTGKGASAVGLTAAVSKDPITGEWTLEGGALVLADRGVCCIDEFDKMSEQDRTSIHEAMEQQSISISKAGIVTTLQARCAVVAAANPIGGRYDSSKTFSENVQLTDPILTRFDVLCVLRDEVDPVLDGKLAEFVVRSHVRSHPRVRGALELEAAGGGRMQDSKGQELEPEEEFGRILEGARSSLAMSSLDEGASAVGGSGSELPPIPQDLLRKYIVYARTLKPSLTNIDQEKVTRLYADLRKESEVSNGVPIAVRHIESIMRISEACARMRLAPMVSDTDLNLAIRTIMESFISAQKAGVQVRVCGLCVCVGGGLFFCRPLLLPLHLRPFSPRSFRNLSLSLSLSLSLNTAQHTHPCNPPYPPTILHNTRFSHPPWPVQRTLRNQFQRYLQTDTNNNVLLLVKLRELVRRQRARDAGLGYEEEDQISIPRRDLVEAARAHGITEPEVEEFLGCPLFRKAFAYEAATTTIRTV